MNGKIFRKGIPYLEGSGSQLQEMEPVPLLDIQEQAFWSYIDPDSHAWNKVKLQA